MLKKVALVLISVLPLTAGFAVTARTVKKPKVAYKQVQELLKSECVKCHNNKSHAENVDLHSYGAVMASKVVIVGNPGKSRLITYTNGAKEPRMPMGKKSLTTAQEKLLSDWISQGAKSK
ncbi:MAG TPA: c-type cytochrome domain-containing protein [Fimbriimonas sp.]|nr:c-type cytochrome domain-containing protein [Fimbriimonas sp.]